MRRILLFALLMASSPGWAQNLYEDPETPPGAYVRPPPPEKPRPCAVELKLRQRRGRDEVRIEALLENRSRSPQTVTLQSQCPAPPFTLRGLPDGLDPFQTCNKGACAARDPIVITLRRGESRSLGTGSLFRKGAVCSAPFVGGPFTVSLSIAAEGQVPELCADKPLVVNGYPAPAPEPAAPPTAPAKPRSDCPVIACGGCPHGFEPSTDGCPSCACRQGPSVISTPPPRVR